MQQPEAYLGNAGSFFDENGILNENIKSFLQNIMDAFFTHIESSLNS